jgi:cytochrome P450
MNTAVAPAALPRSAPGPRGAPIVGCLRTFRADPLKFLVETARAYGPVAHLPLGLVEAYLVSQPGGVKRVLQDNSENYGRQTRGFQALRMTLGSGLITEDGAFWKRQRRLAQPAFHKARLAAFGDIMARAANEMTERLRAQATQGQPIDVAPEMSRVTLAILGRSLFSLDLDGAAEAVGQAVVVVLRHTIETVHALIPLPRALPTPRNRRFAAALRTLDKVVMDSIAERRRDGVDRGDLLSMLLAARDEETGEGMTDRQLRDEVMTLMLAGHETTAMTLCWTLYLLSRHPAARRTLEAEVDRVLGGRVPSTEDLPRLPYTRMVIEEAMRLYPPAWGVTRSIAHDDEIDGFAVPAGAIVIVSPYTTHRDEALWPNPEGFDPDRFDAARESARPRYAYFPFGGGPHLCIGAGFAMMEAQIILATLAQRLRLDLVPGHPVEVEPLVTLRPRHGIQMTLHPR